MVAVSYGSLPEARAPLRKRGTAALLIAGLALCAAAAVIGFAVVAQVAFCEITPQDLGMAVWRMSGRGGVAGWREGWHVLYIEDTRCAAG